jgi:lysyl-tRNA synthetase class 1
VGFFILPASAVEPKQLFSAIYFSILGKESGPKAGWFLSVLPKDFLIKRLKEVTA